MRMTDDDVTAVMDCLRSGWLTLGPRTLELEERAAPVLGVAHAIATSSGSAAILLALRALAVTEAALGPEPSRAALAAARFLSLPVTEGPPLVADLTQDPLAARGGALACAWSLPVGDGGLLGTDDGALAAKVRSLRSHAMTSGTWDRHKGHQESYDIVDLGFNFRLDEPRAALATARLDRFAGWPPGL